MSDRVYVGRVCIEFATSGGTGPFNFEAAEGCTSYPLKNN